MIHDLPEEVRLGLRAARTRNLRRRSRWRLHAGDEIYPILRLWKGGFALEAAVAPHVRGFVDIYDGSRHLYQCLVVCSALDGDERVYEFKRQTAVVRTAPLDFYRDENAPLALLP